MLCNSRQQQVTFPVFSDAQVGLTACASYERFAADAKKDEDVASDEDVLDLAIKCCSHNFLQTKRYLPLDPLQRHQSIRYFVKNCSIAQRVAYPDFFTRSGHPRF